MHTQKHLFDIPGQVLQCDYVVRSHWVCAKKKHMILLTKKKRCYIKKQFARSDLTFLILGVERSDFVRFLEIIFLKFESKIEMLTWVFPKSKK